MSNLLEQASLVLIPSGYKEDVVYSEIPLDGSGDLQFTRSSNGTRINSAGLLEVCPWNLLQQSENFPNAVWGKSTLTFNSTVTAPNGTSTAQNYSTAGAYSYALQTITVSSGEYYTVSCYLKYTSGVGSISIGYTDAPSNNYIRVDANLINGTIGSVSYGGNGANGTATITSVGDGWYRVTVSGTLTIGNAGLIVSNLALGATTFSIWGAQLNSGSTAKPYFPTTDRLNVPRLTYQNGGGGCPSLLLEKQSTNLITNSEDFTQTSWTKYQATITGNNTTSPDGTQNADKFVDNTNNDIHAVYLGITISSDTTISIYVKSAEYTRFAIANLSDGGDVIFNLSTVAVVSASANFQNNKIESVGNGWYRVSATTNGTSGGKAMGFMLVNDSNQLSFVGTGSKGVYIWGAQYETSSYATSYIPTTSSSATRVADACSKTGISSLIGQTEGVVFADFIWEGSTSGAADYPISIYGSSYSDFVGLSTYENTNSMYVYVGGSNVVAIGGTNFVNGQRYKIAMAYKSNDFVYYMNGTQMGTDTSGSVPSSMANFQTVTPFGNKSTSQKYNELIFFPTRLTNAELASLTTI